MDEETTGLYRLRNLIRNNIPLHFLVISENKFYHFQVGLFVCFFLSFFLSFFFLSFFLSSSSSSSSSSFFWYRDNIFT